LDECKIYDAQIAPQVRRHVAPHATRMAAMFAVLTRMRRPNSDRYEGSLKKLIEEMTAFEKMDLYSQGIAPSRLDDDSQKSLRSAVERLFHESETYPIYEGSIGASPREMRTVLLDAAQSPHYQSLSPLAVLEELDRLCERSSEYAFLQEERMSGGYHDHALFRTMLRERLLDAFEDEFRVASGLVEETRYTELFDRYVQHVSFWVKNEKIRNPMTGDYEDPDERLMKEVEKLLGVPDKPEQLRHSIINTVAAWAIDHRGEMVDNARVFASHIGRLREAVFSERRVAVARLSRDIVILLREEGSGLDLARTQHARKATDELARRFGYDDSSVADAAVALIRERFHELLG
jgi:serine protein kinase